MVLTEVGDTMGIGMRASGATTATTERQCGRTKVSSAGVFMVSLDCC
jgi:hypothetical protein